MIFVNIISFLRDQALCLAKNQIINENPNINFSTTSRSDIVIHMSGAEILF